MHNTFKVSPCSRGELRAFANRFRQVVGMETVLDFPIVDVFEVLAAEEYYDFQIVPIEEMEDRYADTSYRDKLIRIREDIYDESCRDNPFSRSTIAHELLHFFKHRQEKIVFCKTVEELATIKPYENAEWQANCFAGELLVPKHLVENLTVKEVMEQCKVSREMAEYQLRQYKKEGWNNKKSLRGGTLG